MRLGNVNHGEFFKIKSLGEAMDLKSAFCVTKYLVAYKNVSHIRKNFFNVRSGGFIIKQNKITD